MTDRELLELAAKAAGEVQGDWIGNAAYLDGVLSRWNPLTDDGDALRLAVKLGISVMQPSRPEDKAVLALWERGIGVREAVTSDPLVATRRAIVRAAAKIQRMKENNDAAR